MTSQTLLNQALGLHRDGRLAEAEPLYLRVLAAEPQNFQCQYLAALLRYQLGRGPEALALVDAALANNPALPEAFALRGALMLGASRPGDALAAFTRAAELKPDYTEAWYNRGVALAELGRLEEAVAAFDRALALQPGAEIWNGRGAALQGLRHFDEALRSFDSALALRPDAGSLYNRGTLLLALDRPQDAIADFDRVLAQNPQAVEVWHNRGVALQGLQRLDQALASYDSALAVRPDYAPAWNNRGAVLQRLKRLEEAIISHDKALALQPDNVSAWHGRGTALFTLKRVDAAIESFDRALALDPRDAESRHMRGRTLQVAQRFDEALAELETSLALRPDDLLTLAAYAAALCEAKKIAQGIDVYARYAALAYGGTPTQADGDPEHKQRHDAEQQAWLAAQGVVSPAADGARLAGPAVNPVNAAKIETQWRDNHPQIVVIDNLLTPEALEKLRRFCWGAPIWRKAYKNGYLGAMPEHGFACPLLAQIAEELSATYPAIFGEHGLTMLWGFKYDGSLGGIRIHADQAAVNVNFWITPDEANRDPDHGGLVIWDASAPLDWDITKYNGDDDAVRAFLAEAGAKPTTVPYRANRAVIFNSDLFHETDRLDFAEGYQNRRINVTLLYGRRTFDAR